MSAILAAFIAFISMFVPGTLLALALLKGTKLHLFEILVIGFLFGFIAPATLTWIDSYFASYIHLLSFSMPLFEVNVLIISVIGAAACFKEGVFSGILSGKSFAQRKADLEKEVRLEEKVYAGDIARLREELKRFEKAGKLIEAHSGEESELKKKHAEELRLISSFNSEERKKVEELHKKEELELTAKHIHEEKTLLSRLEAESRQPPHSERKTPAWVWVLLLALMVLTFSTRMFSYSVAPKFFQFDTYFDMLGTQQLLVFGYQPLYSPSAWPALAQGSLMRVQPLILYVEAYWYDLANIFGAQHTTFNTTLMSQVSSVYPPIVAALLVFVVFMLLYREYDEYVGLIGASFAVTVPILFTTFIAGQQLLQPWGIFSLFFFFMAYMLAAKNPKSVRLAILAGVAFASTFLGAHYYTVDAGILALYIIIQGMINTLRANGVSKSFYKMNAIVIAVIAVFVIIYEPYGAVYGGGLPTVLGIPITVAFPLLALIFIAVIDMLPRYMGKRKLLFKGAIGIKAKAAWLALILLLIGLAMAFTPLGNPIRGYVNLTVKFTTPSTPLFMTVQEYAPTGPLYNFGAAGIGLIGASVYGFPLMIYLVLIIAIVLLLISIFYRKSDTGILYLAISLISVAAFSEVAYIPHFTVAYIMLFGIIIGEIGVLAGNGFSIKFTEGKRNSTELIKNAYVTRKGAMYFTFFVALLFLSPIIATLFMLAAILFDTSARKSGKWWALFAMLMVIEIIVVVLGAGGALMGESASIVGSIQSFSTFLSNPSQACSIISSANNQIGFNIFCNTIPDFWVKATNFMLSNIGPNGPRVLSWWDYGDWINWFGQTPTVLRGDNAVPKQDFATAANFVLSPKENYGPQTLANFMNSNQSSYVLFDQDLIVKWGALDFLACVNINQTSKAYAIAQGQSKNPPVSYILGSSQCELKHDPQYVLIPLSVLAPSLQQPTLSNFCTISNSITQYALSYLVVGNNLSNQTVCVSTIPNQNGVSSVYSPNGTKLNAVVQVVNNQPLGATSLSANGSTYLEYLMIYLPNGPNNTITNAPSEFYQSNFYRGFFLGDLPGFTLVYPNNAIGINFVNYTSQIRIFKLNNFTGQLPQHVQKPDYIENNYTFPG